MDGMKEYAAAGGAAEVGRQDVKPLTPVEARVVGALIEKELTTPEYYPLTLNSLVAACNQKSNRSPAMELTTVDVVRALDALRDRRFAWEHTSTATRTPKYRHGLAEALHLDKPQLALLCELFVRGPQTVGELKLHAARMHEFADAGQVLAALDAMAQRPETPLVARLPREPGKREERYAHLLCGPVAVETAAPAEPARLVVAAENERITKLETEVATLRDELAAVRAELADFKAQFK